MPMLVVQMLVVQTEEVKVAQTVVGPMVAVKDKQPVDKLVWPMVALKDKLVEPMVVEPMVVGPMVVLVEVVVLEFHLFFQQIPLKKECFGHCL